MTEQFTLPGATHQRGRVGLRGSGNLLCKVHGIQIVTVTAFQRIVSLQSMPLPFRQLSPFGLELFRGIDGAKYPPPHLDL